MVINRGYDTGFKRHDIQGVKAEPYHKIHDYADILEIRKKN